SVRRICGEMHDFYRTARIKDLQRLCFRASSFPELAMPPRRAYEALVANDVDYVPLDQVKGRVAATLALIYPPGIGVIVHGERWDDQAQPMLGYFQVFYLYFLSLAIGNVAIAISAVGYLASFIPWLSSTPITTCIGVIALLWLTTIANFGGPKITGRIGSVTVWGVILPVGLLS